MKWVCYFDNESEGAHYALNLRPISFSLSREDSCHYVIAISTCCHDIELGRFECHSVTDSLFKAVQYIKEAFENALGEAEFAAPESVGDFYVSQK